MRTYRAIVAVAALFMASSWCIGEEDVSGDKKSMTVIQPGPAGGLTVLSKETSAKKPSEKPANVARETQARKARVVVIPAVFAQGVRSRYQRELYEDFGITDPSVFESPEYTSYLVDALVNCRKFDVLEREDLKSATKEIDFGESDYADMAKVVQMGQMLNADYVVIPEIQFVEYRTARSVPYVGRFGKRLQGRMDVGLRVVDVATSRLASSYMYSSKLRRSQKTDESVREWVAGLRSELYTQSAMEGTAKIIDTVYPVRIVAVDGDTCIVNRGRGAMVEGEVLVVYKPGEVMVDPDTGENLGYHETLVGKIEVTDVGERTSTARIVEKSDDIKKLYVCRREGKVGETPVPAPAID